MNTATAILGVALALALDVLASAQIHWVQRTTSGPSLRRLHAMAYDSQRGVTVMFGGRANATPYLSDTWEWDGAAWLPRVFANSPGGRFSPAMAYDSQRGVVVLFGGVGVGPILLGDTWEWNGAAWTQRANTGPSARNRHAMAYDSQRGVTVMFGGVLSGAWPSDTWEWDGNAWTQRATTGPSARYEHGMAYDSQRGRTILFGGDDGLTNGAWLNDTWEWDGSAWTQRSSIGPSPRVGLTMCYDSQRGVTVMFGGMGGAWPWPDDTWEWNGASWTQSTASGPSGRYNPAMAYDSRRGRAVMFGGDAGPHYPTETWELGYTAPPMASNFGTGCGSIGLIANPNAMPSIGSLAQANVTNCPTGLGAMTIGWSKTNLGSFSLPIALSGYGAPGCQLLTSCEQAFGFVSFSGPNGTYSLAIPTMPQLIGTKLFLQAHAFAPSYNAAQIMLSQGLEWTIGT